MIIMIQPDAEREPEIVRAVMELAGRYPGISAKPYQFTGSKHSFTEVHLIGSTAAVPTEVFEAVPGVMRVVRVSTKYRLIGRHDPLHGTVGFTYNGVRFDDSGVHVFAGLCAVDTPEHVNAMMAALAA